MRNQADGKEKKVWRLAPCPSYDIEGMEGWLTELAEEGLLLERDGFWGGLAVFSYGKPQQRKYRLEAAPGSTSMWAENYGEPDPEAVALSQAYHWDYLAKRGDFYIYCSDEPGERELNTDPRVQSLALKAVKKRRISALLPLLFWLLLYVCLTFFIGIFLTIITARSWFFLWGAALAVWMGADSIYEVIFLGKMQRRLQEGEPFLHTRDWRKRQRAHLLKNLVRFVLIAAWIVLWLQAWSCRTLREDVLPLPEYQKELPFATMKDFAEEELVSYESSGMGVKYDGVREWSDWLAPRNISWSEHARIQQQDGSSLNGGLRVEYHQTANVWLAERLALEYERYDRFNGKLPDIWRAKKLEYLSLSEDLELSEASRQAEAAELGVDRVAAYFNQLDFPTVVLQKGNEVLHATFYQVGEEAPLPLKDWVRILAESLSKHEAFAGEAGN